MTRMVPAQIDQDSPNSEKRVFELLRADPATNGWIALHSLGLAKRGRHRYGEIDFVVLIPDLGVLCLEVMGGRVRCDDGVWFTKDRNGTEARLNRSPVMQAREGMFAVRDALKVHFGAASSEASVAIASAVVFPDVDAPPFGVEAERWEIIDRRDLSGKPISVALRNVLRSHLDRSKPTRAVAETGILHNIRSFLRPDFDVVVARATTVARAEEQILSLTENQYDVLDNIELNHRCVVDGAAGTGKTLLALQLARRAVSSGLRPVVLCFNRLLGQWLEAELADLPVLVGSYARVLRQLIMESPLRGDFLDGPGRQGDPVFVEWPLYAAEALSDLGAQGDLLIVDEAQDLAHDRDLDVFNLLIRGGLAGGKWAMMGDFSRQSIYGGPCAVDGLAGFDSKLSERTTHYTTLRLSVNCRNTRQIAEETAILAGFTGMPYRLGAADGPAVDVRYWRSQADQIAELKNVLEGLWRDGFSQDQITILSPYRLESSVASSLDNNVYVGDDRGPRDNAIRFSTIHAFKGMETPVAILTDLLGMEAEERQPLLYVGMSRARTYLVMLLHETFRPFVMESTRRRIARLSE